MNWTLRNRNSFTRDDGTPLNYTLVNINDSCKNTFEVVGKLRINTDNSHLRYDVMAHAQSFVYVRLSSVTMRPQVKQV